MSEQTRRAIADDRGQALPLALMALAAGAIAVAPFLTSVGVNLIASRHTEAAIEDYYAADAGIEWGLWRLSNDPALTASATYTEAPLQPTPASINGAAFPTTEVRYVAGAGMMNAIEPSWQNGAGAKCYPFTSTEDGMVTAIITTGAAAVRAALRTSCDGSALPDLAGSSPYTVQFVGQPAGDYELVVEAAPPVPGALTIIYPVAGYDLRSQRDGRTITARAAADASSVTLLSWQLD